MSRVMAVDIGASMLPGDRGTHRGGAGRAKVLARYKHGPILKAGAITGMCMEWQETWRR